MKKRKQWTVQEGIEAAGIGVGQIGVLGVACLGSFSDAMEIILLSYLGPILRCEWRLSAMEETFLTMGVFAGMCIGSIVFAITSDTPMLGRRVSTIYSCAIVFAAGVGSALSPSFEALCLFRILVGFGIAGTATVPNSLMMEFIPVKNRGLYSQCVAWAWALGVITITGLGWIVLPDFGWRVLCLIASIPAFFTLVLSLAILPESPYFYLFICNDVRSATITLNSLASRNGQRTPPGQLVSVHEDEKSLLPSPTTDKSRQEMQPGICAVCRNDVRSNSFKIWTLWLCCSLSYYGTVLVTTSEKSTNPEESTVCNSMSTSSFQWSGESAREVFDNDAYRDVLNASWGELLSALISIAFIESSLGRTGLILSAFVAFVLTFFMLWIATDRDDDDDSIITTLLLLASRAATGVSFNVVYTLTTEFYDTKRRAAGLAIVSLRVHRTYSSIAHHHSDTAAC
eukprot:g2348.t1